MGKYIREYDRDRGNRQTAEDLRIYRAKNPKKYAAHQAVGYAIKSGALVKNDNCVVCTSDYAIEGHHDDYDQPLEVRWLCSLCHGNWHSEFGEGANAHY